MGVFPNRSDKLCGRPHCQFGSVNDLPNACISKFETDGGGGRQVDLISAFPPPFLNVPTLGGGERTDPIRLWSAGGASPRISVLISRTQGRMLFSRKYTMPA